MTIKELRQKGWKVRITYKRYVRNLGLMSMFDIRNEKLQKLIEPRGGFSLLDATSPQGNNYTVEAFCKCDFDANKKGDSFNRRIALNILVGRLMKQIASH